MSLETLKTKVGLLIENKKLYDLIFKTNTYKRALFADFEGETIPQLNYSQFSSFWYFARNSKITHIDFYINSSSCTEMIDAFSGCKQLKSMVGIDTSEATNVGGMFYGCSTLETIGEPLDFNKVTKTNAIFTNTFSLKEIRFVAETIKVSISFINVNLLSAESIQSIIDGLATVETAQTLTLNTDVKAKLTQTQLDTITSKNWNLA